MNNIDNQKSNGGDKNMKFRAVVITKKRLVTALVSAVIVTAIGISEAKSDIKYPISEDMCYNMIDTGVGGGKKINLKATIQKLLGFAPDNPKALIDKGIGNGVEHSDNSDIPDTVPIIGEDSTELPTKAMINEGNGLSLNNATDYDVDLEALCSEDLSFSIDPDSISVLVMHTHTTECYDGDQMEGETERTTDPNKSVVAVGNIICDTLESYGIHCYHDVSIHDYPSYQGSYTRAMQTIENDLNTYRDVKVVLDVHRDAFVYEDGTKLRVVCEGAAAPTSQVMLVSGTDSMGLYNPNWRENLKFAAKIQSAANIMYPNLMRSINLRTERFNLHETKGSLILEVGSNGNTLEEALNAGRDVAKAIAAVLVN